MKRFAVALMVGLVALAAPMSVGAANKKYTGVFESTGTNSFALKKSKRGKKVFNYEWVGFPLTCDGGTETSSNGLNFSVRVKNRKFETVAVPDGSTIEKTKLSLRGKFVGRTSAEGTMRIQGSRVPLDGGGKDSCDSGKVAWTAARVTR